MPRRISTLLFVGAIITAGAGCASRQPFSPATNVSSISPEGYAAAAYDLDVADGTFAQTRVWSDGAIRRDFEGTERTFVHVGFDVENESNETLEFDTEELILESAAVDDEVFEDLVPSQIVGDTAVPPGESLRIDAWFLMPPDVDPDDVEAFRVHWSLHDPTHRYARSTPFAALRTYDPYAYYYSPYYDPFYTGPYYGWGYGGYYGYGLYPENAYTFSPPAIVHPYPYQLRDDVATYSEPMRAAAAPRRRQ